MTWSRVAQPVDKPGLFLAVSHNSACNDPWLRGQLAKKMTELPASGLTEAALQRNIERWKRAAATTRQYPKTVGIFSEYSTSFRCPGRSGSGGLCSRSGAE